MASLVIGAAAGAIGFAIGGPFGAAIGFNLGVLGGNLLFPDQPKTAKPQIDDLRVQGSQYGSYIPYVHGTDRVDGTVIWAEDKIPHEVRSSSGGKGGGSSAVTGYTYTQSFAVLICQGEDANGNPPIAGVVKIWANGLVVYDGTNPGQFPFTLYRGTLDQMPDPVIEGIEGVGNVEANRGRAYIVFENMDLSPWGNALPQLSFLVTHTLTENWKRVTTWDPRPWAPDSQPFNYPPISYDGTAVTATYFEGNDPTVGGEGNTFHLFFDLRIVRYSEYGNKIDETVAHVRNTFTEQGGGRAFKCKNSNWMWVHKNEAPYERDPSGHPGVFNWYDLYHGSAPIVTTNASAPASPPTPNLDRICTTWFVASWDGQFCYMLGDVGPVPGVGPPVVRKYTLPFDPATPVAAYEINTDDSDTGDQYTIDIDTDGTLWIAGGNHLLHLRDDDDHISLIQEWIGDTYVYPHLGYARNAMHCGSIVALVDGDVGLRIVRVGDVVPFEELGTIPVAVGDDTFAEFAWNLGDGLGWVQDGLISLCTAKGGGTTLDAIVTRESSRSAVGDSLFNVDELGESVEGYKIASLMTRRAAIESLQPAFYFYSVEEDGMIKFPKFGKGPVVTIDDDDLGCAIAGESFPADMPVTRLPESSLPRTTNVTYEDPTFDYQPNSIPESRQSTLATDVRDLRLAIVLPKQKAKEIAQLNLFNEWIARTRSQISVPRKYADLSPGDVIVVKGITWRITQIDAAPYGPIKMDLERCIIDGWSGGGSGAENGGGPPSGGITFKQQVALRLLDIPYIDDRQDAYSAAMSGIDRAGVTKTLFKSSDGGTNYSALASTSIDDAMGTLDVAMPGFAGGNVFDEGSVAYVTMTKGSPDLEGTTRPGIFRGDNLGVIGEGATAELIQFRDAPLISATPKQYKLHGMLRGRNGTKVRSHAAGEPFALLPTQTRLVAPYAEHGLARQFKAVAAGSAVATATAVELTSQAVSMAPYPPVHLRAGFDGSGNIIMRATRCARLNNAWLDVAEVPIGEPTESYRFRIWVDGTYQTVKRKETVLGPPEFIYTTADQTTDWGAPLTYIPAWSIAQIGQFGPGYEAPTGILPAFVPVSGGGGTPPVDTGFLSIMDWASPARLLSHSVGGLLPGSVWCIQVTPGSTPNPDVGHMAKIAAAEFAGPPSLRIATLSPIRGDLGPQPLYGANIGPSTSITAYFAVGSGPAIPGYPTIPFSTPWYLNIKSLDSGYTGSELSMYCDLTKTFV